ncbi:MAG: phosphate/phosphite/phosphonate ABC transporter substrate-binding protein [Candidatus Scalindua sp. AMX11]|nr:MAG: phosphate/phosphite/phosphonate ABC transporter substrate-binding protein [Candidatus Scalindua sp.]NOG83243.1 phosphate/phosphite/phosphonate ABC transporter substrate-binding protein [Planctomycetota bacterium]RZV77611.1 MAG: phosphate/phosphite/phosphonate ABC transporter substrate-binding protein [Candidatus Scalindua sp. SCAELEC01]TDE63516.1 MAG: phosphate/phosphite/phosphonate ABC transporter substrate-binding protein [Candidatus Scalindua sp. AMX11]
MIKSDRNRTLVIGRVSGRPKKHYKKLKPIVDFVVTRMKDLGIIDGSVLIAKDNNEMIKYLQEGKIDWVTETPFSAILLSEKTGAEIILRRWKRGVPDYRSVFFVRKDSGINSLNDLKNKKIAFEDAGSTTAYLVPFSVLKKRGFDLIELSSPREEPPLDKVGYTFVHGELNIATWVHEGLADIGAYSNLDWENRNDTPASYKRNLKIIHQTRPIPRSVELVRKDLDSNITTRIKEVLLNAHNDPEAKEPLYQYSHTTKFDELKGETVEGLQEVYKILNDMRGELK